MTPNARQIRAFAQNIDYNRAIDIAVIALNDSRELIAAPKIIWERVDDPYTMLPPLFSLAPDNAQALMDDLWRAGIRPTRVEDSAGALKATERHLADMQKISFDLMERFAKPITFTPEPPQTFI